MNERGLHVLTLRGQIAARPNNNTNVGFTAPSNDSFNINQVLLYMRAILMYGRAIS